jgi:hypothetical protein
VRRPRSYKDCRTTDDDDDDDDDDVFKLIYEYKSKTLLISFNTVYDLLRPRL